MVVAFAGADLLAALRAAFSIASSIERPSRKSEL